MNRARLIDGPHHGRYVTIDDPLPLELIVDDALYLLIRHEVMADADGVSELTEYGFSKRIDATLS